MNTPIFKLIFICCTLLTVCTTSRAQSLVTKKSPSKIDGWVLAQSGGQSFYQGQVYSQSFFYDPDSVQRISATNFLIAGLIANINSANNEIKMSHVLLLEMDCNARTRVTQNREIFIDGQRSFTPGNENPNKPSDVFTAEGHWFQKILDDECPSIGLMPSIGDKNALLNKIRQKMGGDPQLQNQSLDTAKKKCADLGFKSGTEDFGKCVLKLSK